jgi:hypothetical protein
VENLYKHALSFKEARHNMIYTSIGLFINLIRRNNIPSLRIFDSNRLHLSEYCEEISLFFY